MDTTEPKKKKKKEKRGKIEDVKISLIFFQSKFISIGPRATFEGQAYILESAGIEQH